MQSKFGEFIVKGTLNKFIIKNGRNPERIGALLHLNIGDQCVLVFENDTCVGVVWEHQEKRAVDANGQAEIRFFEKYKNSYGLWHRMFNGQRIKYIQLKSRLEKDGEYIYYGKIKNK